MSLRQQPCSRHGTCRICAAAADAFFYSHCFRFQRHGSLCLRDDEEYAGGEGGRSGVGVGEEGESRAGQPRARIAAVVRKEEESGGSQQRGGPASFSAERAAVRDAVATAGVPHQPRRRRHGLGGCTGAAAGHGRATAAANVCGERTVGCRRGELCCHPPGGELRVFLLGLRAGAGREAGGAERGGRGAREAAGEDEGRARRGEGGAGQCERGAPWSAGRVVGERHGGHEATSLRASLSRAQRKGKKFRVANSIPCIPLPICAHLSRVSIRRPPLVPLRSSLLSAQKRPFGSKTCDPGSLGCARLQELHTIRLPPLCSRDLLPDLYASS